MRISESITEAMVSLVSGGATWEAAADALGVDHAEAWSWVAQNPWLRDQLEEAQAVRLAPALRDAVYRRAVLGVPGPHGLVYSDKLLVYLCEKVGLTFLGQAQSVAEALPVVATTMTEPLRILEIRERIERSRLEDIDAEPLSVSMTVVA